MNYYRRYMADYLSKTASLTLMEHGAYALLLDYLYLGDGQLPGDEDEICRMVRAVKPSERQAVVKVLGLYFTKEDDGYHNKRADEEIAKARNGYGLIGWFKRLPRHARNAIQAKRRAIRKHAMPKWLNDVHLSAIDELYRRAAELTESTGIPHHVDHIVPLVNRAVCGLHVPWNLQVITAAENSIKSNVLIEAHEVP